WFDDENTVATQSLGSVSLTRQPWTGPSQMAPGIGTLAFGYATYRAAQRGDGTVGRFDSITIDGSALDASELDLGDLVGSGSSVTCTQPGIQNLSVQTSGIPYRFTYDLDVTRFGEGSTQALLD